MQEIIMGSLLYIVHIYRNIAAIKSFVSLGADVNVIDNFKSSVIHLLARNAYDKKNLNILRLTEKLKIDIY